MRPFLAALATLLLGSCYDAAYLVVHVDAALATPAVAQLSVTVAEGSASDTVLVPATPAMLTFPTSFTLKLSSGTQAQVGVSIDARNASGLSVASAYGVAEVHGAGRTELYLTLGPTCTPTTSASCGACGRACSSAGTTALACTSGLCTPTCTAGLLDCIRPAAPAPDDGCESVPCGGGTCPNAHTDGLSPPHFYYDCSALGTLSQEQATRACQAAATGDACSLQTFTCNAAPVQSMCRTTAGVCYCWSFTGDGNKGHVHSAAACACGTVADPTWN